MGVGFGGTLDSQRGSCKFIFKKVLVQQVEQLIEIASNTVIRSQLFRMQMSSTKLGKTRKVFSVSREALTAAFQEGLE